MIIAYHSVLILDKETFFHVQEGSHFANVSRTDIPAVVHPNPSPPPLGKKKGIIVAQCHIKISKSCLKIAGMICHNISFKPSM